MITKGSIMPAIVLVVLTLLALIHPNKTLAQLDATLYNMPSIPQLKYTNPASNTGYSVYFGFPLISSVYANIHNSGFVLADLMKRRADDSLYFDIPNMINKLGKNNILGLDAQLDWLSFGIKKKKNWFFFNVTEKASIRIRYPKDLLVLLWEGNAAFVDKTIDFSGAALRAVEYREYAFGMARDLNEHLTVGAKLKLLYGIANVSTKVKNLELYTAPNTYELTGTSDMVLNTSTPPDDVSFFPDYLFIKSKNLGMGIDLGASYKLNDRFDFSASLIDLGAIKWKTNTRNYSNKLDGVTFEGNSINTFIDTAITKPFETIFDSLKISFINVDTTQNAYWDALTPRFYLGGGYSINETNKVGLLIHSEYFKKTLYPSFTLSYNYRLLKWLGASASYSIMHRSYFNIGLGLSFNFGPFQIYAVTDNFVALFNLARINGNIIVPNTAKAAHIRTGINLAINDKNDRDKDGTIDEKDECPDLAGPKELNGCPDRDGDKIIDVHDDCPDEPGLAMYKGCPDRDNDKVIDKVDKCPDTPGPVENKGCPVKLYLLDAKGDTLMAAPLNENGFFVFEKLPDKTSYLFKLDAENVGMVDEVQVLRILDGKETILTAIKNNEGSFIYETLAVKESLLYLISKDGDTLMVARKNEEGYFVFHPLPSDQRYLFLLEGEEKEMAEELLILLIDDKGNEKVITAAQDENNKFKYEFIPAAVNSDLDLLEEEVVPVILLEEEKEIVNTAFDNLEFNFGSDVISFGSYSSLEELSNLLNSKPDWHIKLSGYTDNVGSETANLLLSKKRAEAVKKVLLNRDIAADRIMVKYYGKSNPVASNETPQGRQQNRRVEMLIIQKEDTTPVNKENKNLTAFEGEKGLWFKIQVMASKEKIPLNSEKFKGVKDVQEYNEKGLYKYTISKSSNFDQAANVLLPALKNKGFTQAFVVAFKDGKRIPVQEALKLQNK